MDKEAEIGAKYHKLATEFSKVRSQAAVLKKAVLEEQTKNAELTETVKRCEQTVRKRDQEMESLNFRNEQLTKRIMVLQQELQSNTSSKKGKSKPQQLLTDIDMSILNEEFQKKILENAQLFSTIAEKDMEVIECKERIKALEDTINSLQEDIEKKVKIQAEEKEKYKKEIGELQRVIKELKNEQPENDISEENVKHWKAEAERWKTEYDLIKSKPDSNDKLTSYYESQISKILETNVMLKSETKTVWAENIALKAKLENIMLDYEQLKSNLEKSYEEMVTTNNNYKSQLDAMTEHLAAQNEKITKQCDEIEFLKHKILHKK